MVARRTPVQNSIEVLQRGGHELEQAPPAGPRRRCRGPAAAILQEKQGLERSPELVWARFSGHSWPGVITSALQQPVADAPCIEGDSDEPL